MNTPVRTEDVVNELLAARCAVAPSFSLAKARAVSLAEQVEAGGADRDQTWVHFLPFGTFFRPTAFGDDVQEIAIDDAKAAAMVEEFQRNGGGRRHVDVGHLSLFGFDYEAGKAYGWMVDARVEGKAGDGNPESGVWVLVDWTESGTKARRSREYQLFSPTWYPNGSFDISKGEVDPTPKIHSGALTNTPFFEHYLAAVAASRTAPRPPSEKEKSMPDPTPATPSLSDPERDELATLRAEKQAQDLVITAARRRLRDAVLEKHSKRLAPATLAAMKTSLDPIEDPEKVDAVLSKIPDEVYPTATGSSATPPVSAKANDAEGEVIAAANSLREKEPRLTMQKAMSRVLRKNPDLRKRASEQRASYKIPTEAP